jgi:hypothetical protein
MGKVLEGEGNIMISESPSMKEQQIIIFSIMN